MRTAGSLRDRTGATHILSAITFDPEQQFDTSDYKFIHKKFDLDDFEDQDILTHIPEAVRFIEDAFYPADQGAAGSTCDGTATSLADIPDRVGVVGLSGNGSSSEKLQASPLSSRLETRAMATHNACEREPVNSVFVHCVMGKSRSVALVVAWLLYKYPQRWRLSATRPSKLLSSSSGSNTPAAAQSAAGTPRSGTPIPGIGSSGSSNRILSSPKEAVDRAINWVRDSRSIAEPNEGFHKQLQLWWEMGCPAQPGEMERHPTYARWLYKREVEAAVSAGMAPAAEVIRFEDEKETAVSVTAEEGEEKPKEEYRCHKCRRRLCDERFVIEHVPRQEPQQPHDHRLGRRLCPHVYIEPLSWMRETLERGQLEGRLICPGGRCGNQVGRYSWKGFKCSCGEWVTPAFSLQRSKVDETEIENRAGGLSIRIGPGVTSEHL